MAPRPYVVALSYSCWLAWSLSVLPMSHAEPPVEKAAKVAKVAKAETTDVELASVISKLQTAITIHDDAQAQAQFTQAVRAVATEARRTIFPVENAASI